MNTSKIFLLIVILVGIGAVALVINYTEQSMSEIQPIKLPVKQESSLPEEDKPVEPGKVMRIEKVRDEIKTVAEGKIVKYQQQPFYSENDFSVILESKEEFKSQLIERFKKEIVGGTAENCKVDLNESRKSAILKCDVKGARYSTNSYSMHFLLNGTTRFGFDLYGFEEVGKKLVYQGKVNGIPTKIVFEFPYEFGHCHEHVWPK